MTRSRALASLPALLALLGLAACGGGGGASAPTPAPTVTLSATAGSVVQGGSVTLSWSTTGATSCTASGAWSGAQPTAGSQSSGALAANATYTLSCTGTGGTASASATVAVTPGTPWGHGDIGTVAAAGSFSGDAASLALTGSGAGIGGAGDAFQYAFQSLAGDGSMVARVASFTGGDATARAGLVLRESLAPGARAVTLALTGPQGVVLLARGAPGADSVATTGPLVSGPYWLRLARSGSDVSGWVSPDGVTWTLVGHASVTLPVTAFLGPAVTSHVDGTLASATFDSIRLSSVRISPASAALAPGASQSFQATAADGSAVTVTWQASGGGTISPTGLYTAPSSIPTSPLSVTVTATSTQDALASASATVTITDPQAMTLTPRIAALTEGQAVQFTASAPGGGAISYDVDGQPGGSVASGLIDENGRYVAPSLPGTHTITATSGGGSHLASATATVTDLDGVYTYRHDGGRTGQNLREYALTPASVSGGGFGRRWTCALDGESYAQPLYVAHVSTAQGVRNTLIVVTQHDSVYAFDADASDCATLWTTSFLGSGVTSVPASDTSCDDILGEYGITGTPVVDPATNTLYVVAKTREGTNYAQRLHALDVATGAPRPGSPATIQASVTKNGGGSVSFSPLWNNQRPGLALGSGGVYLAWASHCDHGAYWGWVMRYDASTLAQDAVFNVAPNGTLGGVWMSGGAPALDAAGHVYVASGNGTFDDTTSLVPPVAPGNDFGQSFLRLDAQSLAVQDFYTPSQEAAWSAQDLDIGSAGVLVLPDGAGPASHPNLVLGGDKQGHLWLLDRAQMQRYSATSDNVVQATKVPGASTCSPYCLMETAAYWNGTVYLAPTQGHLLALPLSGGLLPTAFGSVTPASQSAKTFLYPGPSPMVSASPAGDAIVWVLDNNANGTGNGSSAPGSAVLYAYDATDLTKLLYSSAVRSADAAGVAVKFTMPVVANGHVYVAGSRQLTVYGLAP
jgi:hypothetical protein